MKSGITLIETVLYIAVVAIVLPFLATLVLTFHEYQNVAEQGIQIETEASRIFGLLRNDITGAQSISVSDSIFASDAGKLVYVDSETNTTTLDLGGNPARLRLTKAPDPSVWITNTGVRVTKWRIESVRDSGGILTGLRVWLDLESVNPGQSHEAQTFSASTVFSLSPQTTEFIWVPD